MRLFMTLDVVLGALHLHLALHGQSTLLLKVYINRHGRLGRKSDFRVQQWLKNELLSEWDEQSRLLT